MAQGLSDIEYLRAIEALANRVRDEAMVKGWLSYLPDPPTATPLQRAVNELARTLRHVHQPDDGCLDKESDSQ